MQSTPTTWLCKTNLLGLVYVAIALGLVANAVYFIQVNAQWLRAADQLDAQVHSVSFNLGTGSTAPVAIVKASLENPTGRGDLNLLLVTYQVFVNSTNQPFSVQGSSVVGTNDTAYGIGGRLIPAQSSLNITTSIRITADTVDPLRTFLQTNNATLRIFVQIILLLHSSYISLNVPSCTELPGRIPTICPLPRSQTGGGGGS